MSASRCTEGLAPSAETTPGALPAGEGRPCTAQPRRAGLASAGEAGSAGCSGVSGLKTMSAAGGLRRRARLSRLVSFSASHRLHRWGVITCVTASAGLFPLSLRSGAWPHAWVRADLGWAEEEMVKVWGCIAGPHPEGGGRALIPEAPLARFLLWAAPS